MAQATQHNPSHLTNKLHMGLLDLELACALLEEECGMTQEVISAARAIRKRLEAIESQTIDLEIMLQQQGTTP